MVAHPLFIVFSNCPRGKPANPRVSILGNLEDEMPRLYTICASNKSFLSCLFRKYLKAFEQFIEFRMFADTTQPGVFPNSVDLPQALVQCLIECADGQLDIFLSYRG